MKKYPKIDLSGTMYKLFDSCKFDNRWKKIEKYSGPGNEFKSIDNHAAIKIEVKGIEPESFRFKKDSVINIKNGILQYHDQDLLQQV